LQSVKLELSHWPLSIIVGPWDKGGRAKSFGPANHGKKYVKQRV